MTILPENLKSIISSTWDFHPITVSKLVIISAMLFFTVLGLTKAPPKLKKIQHYCHRKLSLTVVHCYMQAHLLNLNRIVTGQEHLNS